MGQTTVYLGIRTPRKNRFLVDRIPGVQWVMSLSSVGISRLFSPGTPTDRGMLVVLSTARHFGSNDRKVR